MDRISEGTHYYSQVQFKFLVPEVILMKGTVVKATSSLFLYPKKKKKKKKKAFLEGK